MKKVVDAHTVAHKFASQEQNEAYTPTRNFKFYGKSIYSYGSHFCIAKFIDSDTLLFTERGYSNTTAKHIALTERATRHINKIYCAYPDGGHKSNFDYWLSSAENIAQNLIKARKPEKYTCLLENIKEKAQKYSAYFKLQIPERLSNVLEVTNGDAYMQHANNVLEFEKQERLRQAREHAKQHAKELKEFRAGKRTSIYTNGNFDYIRVSDTDFVTSQRVCIPIAVGLRFYNNIKNVKPGDKLLSYTVRDITETYIAIGCHKITFKEIDNAVSKVTQLA